MSFRMIDNFQDFDIGDTVSRNSTGASIYNKVAMDGDRKILGADGTNYSTYWLEYSNILARLDKNPNASLTICFKYRFTNTAGTGMFFNVNYGNDSSSGINAEIDLISGSNTELKITIGSLTYSALTGFWPDAAYHDYQLIIMSDKIKLKIDNGTWVEVTYPAVSTSYDTINLQLILRNLAGDISGYLDYIDILNTAEELYTETTSYKVIIDGAAIPDLTTYWYDTTSGTLSYTLTTDDTGAIDVSTVVAGTYRVVGKDVYGYSFCQEITIP